MSFAEIDLEMHQAKTLKEPKIKIGDKLISFKALDL
jgi:hypothetical protein